MPKLQSMQDALGYIDKNKVAVGGIRMARL
jgi:hypothetical protein